MDRKPRLLPPSRCLCSQGRLAQNPAFRGRSHRAACLLLLLPILLAGCATQRSRETPRRPPAQVRSELVHLMPSQVTDLAGWAVDIQQAFAAQDIPATTQNLCAVLAVAGQESGFQADAPVAGLPRIARREIDRRAAAHHVSRLLIDAALLIKSPNGQRYRDRLKGVRTERQLSALFGDFIGMVPLGRQLFGGLNPVRTGGPMQVSVAFAEEHERGYPYPIDGSIRHEVFSRRGGLYFGVLHLLGYPTHYDQLIYRFADFNAGWYASRNAAFQHALSLVSGKRLALDGDLIRYGSNEPGTTELAVRSLGRRIDLSDDAIHRALAQGETLDFEDTRLYRRVYALAEQRAGKVLPQTMLPGITLESPKITRKLTTAWFAHRVDARWQECMRKGGGQGAR